MVQWLDLRSVLVAWKDVREARRAVFDALPILAAAKEVTIGGNSRTRRPSRGCGIEGRRRRRVAARPRHRANTVVPEKAAGVTEQLDQNLPPMSGLAR
jgi:hypothetical protein